MKAEAEKLQPKEAAEAAARDVKSLVDFRLGFFGDFKRKDFNSGLACHGLTSVFD